jgi:hypothetical protein
MFGRMVVDSADINVNAAAQVAHAISVHQVENEPDYYTGIDDYRSGAEPGAGMIGTVFNSATSWCCASVCRGRCHCDGTPQRAGADRPAGYRQHDQRAATQPPGSVLPRWAVRRYGCIDTVETAEISASGTGSYTPGPSE